MALTAQLAFEQFYERINLSGDHRETANTRKDRVVELLKNKLEIVEAFALGSIPRFTAISGYADVDVLVALHHGKHISGKSPTQVLQLVRDALGEYKTNVRKNGQAVTLHYDTWPNVDVVPAGRFVDGDGALSYYSIPDMYRGIWLSSRPKRHSANLEERATACGPSFRRIIKMAKWWNKQHSDFLQSFHIEVMALRAFSMAMSDTPWDVYQFFKSATEQIDSSIQYEGSSVDDYFGSGERSEAKARLVRAADTARDAWHATYGTNNRHSYAISRWQAIFGDPHSTAKCNSLTPSFR